MQNRQKTGRRGEGLEIQSTPLHDLAGHLVHLLMEVSNGGLCVAPHNHAGCLYHSLMELSGANRQHKTKERRKNKKQRDCSCLLSERDDGQWEEGAKCRSFGN